jgi:hypothetical protein
MYSGRRSWKDSTPYVAEQSYGLASIQADFRGYVLLPDRITHYKISPYNFQVDRSRIQS